MRVDRRRFHVGLLSIVLGLLAGWSVEAAALEPGTPAQPSVEREIAGWVVSSDGQPVAGARIALRPVLDAYLAGTAVLSADHPDDAVPPGAQGVSGADGRFRLAVPSPGRWQVTVAAAGRVTMRSLPRLVVGSLEMAPVVLELDRDLSVRVLDQGGRPAAGLRLIASAANPVRWRASGLDGWTPAERWVRTDDDGRALVPMAEGERLRVVPPPSGRPQGRWEDLDGQGGAVDLVLGVPRAAPIQILVRGADGEPVGDVLVRGGGALWPLGRTDRGGRWVFEWALDRPCDLLLETADGRRVRHRIEPEARSGAPVEIDLEPARQVAGSVLDAEGRGLPAAWVWSLQEPGRVVQTDRDGHYHLPTMGRPSFDLAAGALGRVTRAQRVSTADVTAGRAPSLALDPTRSVVGFVVDGEGRPKPGARVEGVLLEVDPAVLAAQTERAAGRAVADERGHFRLSGFASSDLRLTVRLTGHGVHESRVTVPETGADVGRLVVRPERSGFGTVVDLEDQPISGARVLVSASSAPRRDPARVAKDDPTTGRSDSEGRFVVPSLPGQRVDLEVAAPGFTPLRIGGVELDPEGDPVDLGTLVLTRGVTLAGRVVDLDDRPVAGARIHALDGAIPPARLIGRVEQRLLDRPHEATTDSEGRFLLEDRIPGDRVHLAVLADGYVPAWSEEVAIPSPTSVVVALEGAAVLEGWVRDEDGEPIAGAAVQAFQAELQAETGLPMGWPRTRLATTDAQGRFSIGGLRAGSADVAVEASGYVASPPRPLDVPASGVAWTLARGHVVEGWAGVGDDPLPGVRVTAADAHARSDAEGRFRLDGVAGGTVVVVGHHSKHGAQTLEVEVGPSTEPVVLAFEPGKAVPARAVDFAGEPIPGAVASLTIDGDHGPVAYQAVSGDDGTLVFEGVVPGTYAVRGRAAGYARFEGTHEVADDAAAPLTLRFEPAVRVSGQILGLEVPDLAGVAVWAEGEDSRERRGSVRYDGAYAVDGLGPGAWTIVATAAGGERAARARLAVDGTVEVVERDLEFGSGHTLTGRVLLGGEPLPGTEVALDGLERTVRRQASTSHDGRFVVAELDAGPYRLRVSNAAARVVHNETFELYGDHTLDVDLRLATLRGEVSTRTAEVVADALVTLRREVVAATDTPFLITASTSPDGRFVLPQVPPGVYRLDASHEGHGPASRTVTVEADRDIDGLDLVLETAAGLDLEVRWADGRHPPNARILVRDARGAVVVAESRGVGPEGTVRFTNVPAGNFQITVTAPGAVAAVVPAEVPGPAISVVLQPAAELVLRVPDLVVTDLVGAARLYRDGTPYQPLDDPAFPGTWPIVHGAGRITGLPPADWLVEVTATDGRSWRAVAVTDPGGARIVTLE